VLRVYHPTERTTHGFRVGAACLAVRFEFSDSSSLPTSYPRRRVPVTCSGSGELRVNLCGHRWFGTDRNASILSARGLSNRSLHPESSASLGILPLQLSLPSVAMRAMALHGDPKILLSEFARLLASKHGPIVVHDIRDARGSCRRGWRHITRYLLTSPKR
jgi:hypothetical protein